MFEKTYGIQKDNRLIITFPERFKSKKRVKIFIEEAEDEQEEKIN